MHALGLLILVIMAELSAVEAEVWLLYLQSSGGTMGSLSLNVVRELCSYFQNPRFFAAIGDKCMELYDFNTRKTTRH